MALPASVAFIARAGIPAAVDKKTESGAAFRRAFKEANAKGQKTFSFEGQRYSTDKK